MHSAHTARTQGSLPHSYRRYRYSRKSLLPPVVPHTFLYQGTRRLGFVMYRYTLECPGIDNQSSSTTRWRLPIDLQMLPAVLFRLPGLAMSRMPPEGPGIHQCNWCWLPTIRSLAP